MDLAMISKRQLFLSFGPFKYFINKLLAKAMAQCLLLSLQTEIEWKSSKNEKSCQIRPQTRLQKFNDNCIYSNMKNIICNFDNIFIRLMKIFFRTSLKKRCFASFENGPLNMKHLLTRFQLFSNFNIDKKK